MEAPERIWLDVASTADNWVSNERDAEPHEVQYVRADLLAAAIIEAEQRGYARAMDAERKMVDAAVNEARVEGMRTLLPILDERIAACDAEEARDGDRVGHHCALEVRLIRERLLVLIEKEGKP